MGKRKLGEFVPQRQNANKHTQRGLGMLERAMRTSGYVAPITATADGEVIDGSARLEVAAEIFDGYNYSYKNGDAVLLTPVAPPEMRLPVRNSNDSINAVRLCECGCGQSFLRFSPDGKRDRRFIHGHNSINRRVAAKCDQCGIQISYPAYLHRDGRRHFCGQPCARKHRRDAPEVKCVSCGAMFRVPRVRLETARFCSMACKQGAERVTRACCQCGDSVTRHQSAMRGERIYCSRSCQHKYQSTHCRGENHPNWINGRAMNRGATWPVQRRKALERDGGKCQRCAAPNCLNVHHIKPARCFENKDDANYLENLTTVCNRCHPAAETESRRLFPVGKAAVSD